MGLGDRTLPHTPGAHQHSSKPWDGAWKLMLLSLCFFFSLPRHKCLTDAHFCFQCPVLRAVRVPPDKGRRSRRDETLLFFISIRCRKSLNTLIQKSPFNLHVSKISTNPEKKKKKELGHCLTLQSCRTNPEATNKHGSAQQVSSPTVADDAG